MWLIRLAWGDLSIRKCWNCGQKRPWHYGWCHKVWSDSGWN